MSALDPDPAGGWVKSSLSASGDSVEVAHVDGGVMVRHSGKAGAVLEFTDAEWEAFVGGVRLGEFDGFGGSKR